MEINVSIFIGGLLRGSKVLQTPCTIGRSKEAVLTVAHPSMSRKHCEVYEEGGKLFLRDNSSLNGTLFKGDYVEKPVELKFGEEFVVGELVFKISQPPEPLTEEQKQLANQPTAAFTLNDEGAEEAGPGMETILETPRQLADAASPEDADKISADQMPIEPEKAPENETDETSKSTKGSKKISPKDVQIKF